MIDKIVEMISGISIPQGIMIGFCAFLFVTVIIIIWRRTRRTISTLLFILEEIRRIHISLNNIEGEMATLTYAINNSDQGSHLQHKKAPEPDAVGVKVQGQKTNRRDHAK